jgi:hypothetical protein
MIKNVLTSIGGIEGYGVLSLCLFFAVFLAAVILALRIKKSTAEKMSALPLEDAQPVKPHSSHEQPTT